MDQTLRVSVTNPEVSKTDTGVRRTRLREFQAQLVERMQAAQRGTHVQSSQLGIVIGQSRYLLDLREAGEIVSVGALTAVPLTKDWYVGLSNIRGNLTSVVDLSRFDGGEPTKIDNSCRIVAFASSLSSNNGLLVSQVLGLRSIAEMEELPAETGTGKDWLVRKFRDREGRVWSELSLAALLQDQAFLHIAL